MLNDAALDDLMVEAFQGRTVLLLGQGRFSARTDDDELWKRATAKLGRHPYDYLLNGPGRAEERQAVIKELSEAIPLSEDASQVGALPWSAILTSSVDSDVTRPFVESTDRLAVEITSPEFAAFTADGSIRIGRIFGALHREHIEERPPCTPKDYKARLPKAQQFLARLPEMVGPRGVLVVAGWSPGQDWLRARDLSQPLASLAPRQVLILGLDEEGHSKLREDEDFSALIEDGVVLTVPSPLSDVVRRLTAADRLDPSIRRRARDGVVLRVLTGRAPTLHGEHLAMVDVAFSGAEWRQYSSRLVLPVELELTAPPPHDPAQRYHDFRELVAKQPGRDTLGIVETCAFLRPEIERLTKLCVDVCSRSSPQESAIVVRGQSGSGKSILLNLLVVRLRRFGLPVAYLPPGALAPDLGAIDLLCQQIAERSESQAPLFLIYDGLREVEQYFDLARYFASRGRKCVVVGSAYSFQAKGRTTRRSTAGGRRELRGITEEYVDVPVRLRPAEVEALLKHISRFVGETPSTLREVVALGMGNFFAIVYRALPVTRGPLEAAFIRECTTGGRFLDQAMRELAESQRSEQGLTTLEVAFREALGKRLDELVHQQDYMPADVSADDAQEMSESARGLFDVVMLSSYLGHELPQPIALRLLNHRFRTYRGVFTAGLLDEREVAVGQYVLLARSPVEADIWVRRHLPEREKWISTVARIFNATSGSALADDYSNETELVLDICRAIGPEGPQHLQCPTHFGEVGQILKDLRVTHGRITVRILLMESHLVREWVHHQQKQLRGNKDREARFAPLVEKLAEAEAGLRQAWEQVQTSLQGNTPASRRLLATLETERACIFGTMLGSIVRCLPARTHATPSIQARANEWANAARSAWSQSLRLDDSNRIALDSACWIASERWKLGFATEEGSVAWMAYWSDVIDRYRELELTSAQEDRRDGRERDFSEALGDDARVRAVVARLQARGGSEGRSLLARLEARSGGPSAGRRYLEREVGEGLKDNELLLPLYLRYWWEEHTKLDRFLPRQRLQIGMKAEDWKKLLTLVEARIHFEPANTTMLFLRAAALIHLSDVRGGIEQLREVDRLGVGGYRAAKSLMLRCNAQGIPLEYAAVYQGRTAGTAHLAWCDQLKENVQFRPIEFGKPEIRPGATIGPFVLSIRFRGLFAERPSKGGSHMRE